MATGERGHEGLGASLAAEPEGDDPEADGPAPGGRPEPLDVGGADGLGRVPKQQEGLGEREGQVGQPDLAQPVGDAQALQPQRGIDARDPDHPQPAPRIGQDGVDVGQHRRRAHLLGVVEHEGQRLFGSILASRGGRVDEGGQEGAHRAFRRRCERPDARRPAGDSRDRGRDVDPELAPVVVARVEREPGHRPGGPPAGPLADQDGLAGSGRRGHEGERMADARIDRVEQPRTRHRAAVRRRPQPGRDHRRGGVRVVDRRSEARVHASLTFRCGELGSRSSGGQAGERELEQGRRTASYTVYPNATRANLRSARRGRRRCRAGRDRGAAGSRRRPSRASPGLGDCGSPAGARGCVR